MIAEPLVDVVDFDFAYRDGDRWTRVLHGLNFTISRGEVFGLVGESGCGKSTMAYQILAYLRENSRIEGGRITFRGRDLQDLDRPSLDRLRGSKMSLVPQNPTTALSPGMRIGRQVTEVLTFHDSFKGEEKQRVEALFQLVGLPDPSTIGKRYPHQLSGGQQQRVVIAMALACDPDLVVLDEPTTGLDVTTQEQIVELLKDLRTRLRMSMLYVTHDLGVLAQIADRVGVMYAGRMVEIAPTADLFARPRHPYTRGLIASIPQIDKVNRTGDIVLRGLLRRDQLPDGCPFQPRCDFADAACVRDPQLLEAIDECHHVACHRWRDIASSHHGASARKVEQPDVRSDPLLVVEQVRLGYDTGKSWLRFLWPAVSHDVVQGLTFTIKDGETFALVGESGSGKSTIAKAVSGLLPPRQGTITFEQHPLPALVGERSREIRRKIQYIFQNPDASLNPRSRVGAILARPIKVFFKAGHQGSSLGVATALDDVRLDSSYSRRFPDQLSGGERQRVAIARALVARPKLLLCDEILSGLDVSVQANIIALLQRLRREHQLSMLFISHDLAVVRNLAHRVGVLFRGHLMEVGDVENIFQPPFHPYTYELLMAVPSLARKFQTLSRKRKDRIATGQGGCVFAGRCQWQIGSICEQQPPPWRDVTSQHRIRCHIPLPELSDRAKDDLLHLRSQTGVASRA
jgi:peptide/nickel transport system ATP-binding protein